MSISPLQQYDRYFQANAVEKGGSFYLQSKIYRAKEMLDEYRKEQEINGSDSASANAGEEKSSKKDGGSQ